MSATPPYPTETAPPEIMQSARARPAITTEPAETRFCTVSASVLNLRKGAGTEFETIAWLKKGEEIEILTEGNWLKVKTAEGIGFVSGRYCEGIK